MPKIEKYTQGTPSWTDYGAPDQHAAKVFYAEIFGWTIYEDNFMKMDPDAPGMFYSMAMKEGSYTCAIHTQEAREKEMGIPPHWKVYLKVDDVDAVTAKVAGLGGQVFAGPFNVFESGRMSIIADPTGAVVNLWQPINHIGAGVKSEPGALSWAELLTREQQKAAQFYSDLLGVGLDSDMPSPDGGQYIVFMAGEEGVAGCMTMPEQVQKMDAPNHWEVYFQVQDVDATVELSESLGANTVVPPMDIPEVGRIAYLIDPQGAGFGVITPESM